MALIDCPNCGRTISHQSKTCIKCGLEPRVPHETLKRASDEQRKRIDDGESPWIVLGLTRDAKSASLDATAGARPTSAVRPRPVPPPPGGGGASIVAATCGLGGLLYLVTAMQFLTTTNRGINYVPPTYVFAQGLCGIGLITFIVGLRSTHMWIEDHKIGDMTVARHWTWLGFLVPFANVIMPMRVVNELFRALAPDEEPPGLVYLWWCTPIGTGLLVFVMSQGAEPGTWPMLSGLMCVGWGICSLFTIAIAFALGKRAAGAHEARRRAMVRDAAKDASANPTPPADATA